MVKIRMEKNFSNLSYVKITRMLGVPISVSKYNYFFFLQASTGERSPSP